MIAFFIVTLLLLCSLEAADAGEVVRASVLADVVSVYDGDTLTVNAHPWPGVTIRTAVRVAASTHRKFAANARKK